MAVDGKDKYSKGHLGREGKVWRAVLEGPEELVFQVLRQVDRGHVGLGFASQRSPVRISGPIGVWVGPVYVSIQSGICEHRWRQD